MTSPLIIHVCPLGPSAGEVTIFHQDQGQQRKLDIALVNSDGPVLRDLVALPFLRLKDEFRAAGQDGEVLRIERLTRPVTGSGGGRSRDTVTAALGRIAAQINERLGTEEVTFLSNDGRSAFLPQGVRSNYGICIDHCIRAEYDLSFRSAIERASQAMKSLTSEGSEHTCERSPARPRKVGHIKKLGWHLYWRPRKIIIAAHFGAHFADDTEMANLLEESKSWDTASLDERERELVHLAFDSVRQRLKIDPEFHTENLDAGETYRAVMHGFGKDLRAFRDNSIYDDFPYLKSVDKVKYFTEALKDRNHHCIRLPVLHPDSMEIGKAITDAIYAGLHRKQGNEREERRSRDRRDGREYRDSNSMRETRDTPFLVTSVHALAALQELDQTVRSQVRRDLIPLRRDVSENDPLLQLVDAVLDGHELRSAVLDGSDEVKLQLRDQVAKVIALSRTVKSRIKERSLGVAAS
ncbi:hypothetical protein ACH5A2_10235 [Streptomyces collinus]|uniref:hypothetical protein n=1 Tax=Streptomyces collinus TaxID=42684 RepID=UPI00379D11C0